MRSSVLMVGAGDMVWENTGIWLNTNSQMAKEGRDVLWKINDGITGTEHLKDIKEQLRIAVK